MWIHPKLKIVPSKCIGRGGRGSFVCLIFEVNIIFGVFIDILDETVDLYHHYRNSLTSHSESLLLPVLFSLLCNDFLTFQEVISVSGALGVDTTTTTNNNKGCAI